MKRVFLLTTLTVSLLISCGKTNGGGNPNPPEPPVAGNFFPEEEVKAFLLERGADLTHYELPIEVKETELLSYSVVEDEECPYFNVLVEDKEFEIAHNIHNFMSAQNWDLEGDIKIDPYEQIGVEYWPEGTELYINIYAYADLIEDVHVVRVVALSGGYSIEEASEKLAQNDKMIASFSRALLENLSAKQSDEEFDKQLKEAVDMIYKASVIK